MSTKQVDDAAITKSFKHFKAPAAHKFEREPERQMEMLREEIKDVLELHSQVYGRDITKLVLSRKAYAEDNIHYLAGSSALIPQHPSHVISLDTDTPHQLKLNALDNVFTAKVLILENELKQDLILAAGEETMDKITKHAPGKLRKLTLGDLLEEIQQVFPKFKHHNFSELVTSSTTWNTATSFSANISRLTRDIRICVQQGYITKIAMYMHLVKAMSNDTAAAAILADFVKINPSKSDRQTFENLTEYIDEHEDDVVGVRDVKAYAANTITSEVNAATTDKAEIQRLTDKIARMEQAHAGRGSRGRGGRGYESSGQGRTRGGRGRGSTGRNQPRAATPGRSRSSSPAKQRDYCFLHGYSAHNSKECYGMRDDPSYTREMKNAVAPIKCFGFKDSEGKAIEYEGSHQNE
jgi:hypothetical protein